MKVTYLGPAGATFSAVAYNELSCLFSAPFLDNKNTETVLAKTNNEIVPLVIAHGGYGSIAMETKAQGRVDPPVNSFIELLENYNNDCPLYIWGAIRMRLNFALMARQGITMDKLTKIVAHPKAIGACRGNIKKLNVETVEYSSNGKAAEDVAQEASLSTAGALAPKVATEKYGLTVLSETFEDEEAITTFFLLGPHSDQLRVLGKRNRSLFVFRAKHIPGALVEVLKPFADEGVNLIHIHSLYTGDGEYDFAIETECGDATVPSHNRAIARAEKFVIRSILFGPFTVLGE